MNAGDTGKVKNIFHSINNQLTAGERVENVEASLREEIDCREKQIEILRAETEKLKAETERLKTETERLKTEINIHKSNWYETGFARLMEDKERLKLMNRQLSIVPVIWGDPEKLFISEKAAVNSCFFNTNSGNITIGDYTYAGSGVSVLAGSHDYEISGFLRRDAEYRKGLDIEIGKGVWLASNCTVLGPCTIEDDAVIAAGAVVVPGTHVHQGEVYAGVPAKKIKKINIIREIDKDTEKLSELINREDGLLFYSGWTEISAFKREKNVYRGHFIEEDKGELYTNLDEIELILVTCDGKETLADIYVGEEPKKEFVVKDEPLDVKLTAGTDDIVKIVIESGSNLLVERK